jgi:hypothetical protein
MGFLWISESAFHCMLQPRVASGDLEGVRKDVATIEDVQTRMFALTGMVQAQLDIQDRSGALQTAQVIEPG